jgi:hypothetical protein
MKDFKKLSMYDESIETTASNSTDPLLGLGSVGRCALLEELQLKLIAMSCFAQEHYNEKAYDVTKMNIDEIKDWIKNKKVQHCS